MSEAVDQFRAATASDDDVVKLLAWIQGAHIAMSEEGIGAGDLSAGPVEFPEAVMRAAFADATPCVMWNYGLIDGDEHARRCDCRYARRHRESTT